MPDLPAGAWNAHWISLSADPREDLGVFGFRKAFDLGEVPSEFKVRVSADERYKLYVNGHFVGFGPQRGDPDHWFYETYDLTPYLKAGRNWIAALVWSFGRWAPMAQMSSRAGFVLEELKNEKRKTKNENTGDLSTPGDWRVARLSNWGFDMLHSEAMNFYIDIGPGEIIDFRDAPWGWRTGDEAPSPFSRSEKGEGVGGEGSLGGAETSTPLPSSSSGAGGGGDYGIWKAPNSICRAEDRGTMGGGTPWMLLPRSIPPMLYEERAAPPVFRRGFHGDAADPVELKDGTPLEENFTLLPDHPYILDYGELLTAYPCLTLSGPPGTTVTLTYAEGLWRPEGGKGNRDQVAGKKMSGYQDRIILDGERRTIEPLWWRTYRYLMIESQSPSLEGGVGVGGRFEKGEGRGAKGEGETTESERRSDESESAHGSRQTANNDRRSSTPHPPLSKEGVILHAMQAIETGYPLREESSFVADDPAVKPIWDVSVRTAKRCAGETYFDCPYYEQLQYVGDTRIQALIGCYLGRDRQLTRNAVETLGWSLMENGLTQSRYPSRQTQVIPPFSLWWVMMLWDQLHYDDPAGRPDFVSFQTMSRVLGRFRKLQKQAKQFWQFGDWVPEWGWGVPPGGANALVHQLTLGLATTAAELYKGFLEVGEAKQRDPRFWTSFGTTGYLVPDRTSRTTLGRVDDSLSEHGEALNRAHAVMFGGDAEPWPTEALAKANAAKCTYYFSYYKHLAQFGRPEHDETDKSNTTYRPYPFDYLTELNPWKEMLEEGLSTFAENPEPTRSDCHAWSAHPILGFFQIVAGVTSTAPGWKKARIMPHPGSLKRFDANIAHPDGNLRVKFEAGKLEIDCPVPFELRWKGKREELKAGRHEVGK